MSRASRAKRNARPQRRPQSNRPTRFGFYDSAVIEDARFHNPALFDTIEGAVSAEPVGKNYPGKWVGFECGCTFGPCDCSPPEPHVRRSKTCDTHTPKYAPSGLDEFKGGKP